LQDQAKAGAVAEGYTATSQTLHAHTLEIAIVSQVLAVSPAFERMDPTPRKSSALENSTTTSAGSPACSNATMSDEAPLLADAAEDIKLKQSGGKQVNLQQLTAPPGVDLGFVKFTRPVAMTLGTTFIIVAGTALGFGIPSDLNGDAPQWINYLSGVIGWIYFMAWSVSFYPQVCHHVTPREDSSQLAFRSFTSTTSGRASSACHSTIKC